jgi:hypothetical protein
MRTLQKMLMIVIVGIAVVGSVDSMPLPPPTTLDLPPNTPGLQNAGGAAMHNGHRSIHVQIALNGGGNADIYFPTDGAQPTTPEVARWSCANIDTNNPNSPITRWYVEMFGAIKHRTSRNYLRAGFDSGNRPARIITFDGNANWGDLVSDPDRHNAPQITKRQLFEKKIREIASNPIGRVLLYRILIEIRRKGATNTGCLENGIGIMNRSLIKRNNHRSLVINLGTDQGLTFSCGTGGAIIFDPADTDSDSIRIANGRIDSISDKDTLDNGLFHELLHWFHFLRNYVRFYKENIAASTPSEYRYISRCYYGNISELLTWGKIDDEEMRTVLGAPDYRNLDEVDLFPSDALLSEGDVAVRRSRFFCCRNRYLPNSSKYYNGDDLSENAYRMSTNIGWGHLNLKMRFGHDDTINPVKISDRFKLAHTVATKCCNGILSQGGRQINNWHLRSGEAAN